MTENCCSNEAVCSSAMPKRVGTDSHPKSLDHALSRRSWLKALGFGVAALGFSGLGSQAMAAASQVKAGKAAEVPIKGAKAYTLKGQYILITQPKKGVFKAFSGICTHMGAQISEVQGNNLVCQLHGSSFDTTTGAVTGGPARSGLPKFNVTNKSGVLYIGIK